MKRFFITPDIQTAIGVLAVDPTIIIVCIDKSSVIESLQSRGYLIFSYEQKTGKTIYTSSLLSRKKPGT